MPLSQKDQDKLLKMVMEAVGHLIRGAHAEGTNVAKEMAKILEKVRSDNEAMALECQEALNLFVEKGDSEKLLKVLKKIGPKPSKNVKNTSN